MTEHLVSRPVGRPSKLTADRVARLADALRQGHTRSTAAALAGIGESTLYGWVLAANQPDAAPEYIEFLAAIKAAEIHGEDELLAIIREAAGKSWQAAAWILERRRPDNWSKKTKVEMELPLQPSTPAPVLAAIENASRTAALTKEAASLARRGIDPSEWPDDVRQAACLAGENT